MSDIPREFDAQDAKAYWQIKPTDNVVAFRKTV
jgi:hypothetical protein